MAACWSRSPRWRWRRASAPTSKRRRIAPARLLVRRGPGALCAHRAGPASPSASWPARARPACRSRQLGMTGGDALTLRGERPISGRKASRTPRRLAAGLHGRRRGVTGEQSRRTPMPMDASEIERLIKARMPDADVTIRDLAGDGDHYAATVSGGIVPRQDAGAAAPDRLRRAEGRDGRRAARARAADRHAGAQLSEIRSSSPGPLGCGRICDTYMRRSTGSPGRTRLALTARRRHPWASSNSSTTRSRATTWCCS